MGNHFDSAKKHIRRAPYQALSAVLIMTITFFVATVLALLAYGTNSTLKYYETSPKIITFLKNEASQEEISQLQRELQGDSRIKDVEYVTKEQALEIFKKASSDRPLVTELVSPKIFPASLEFSVVDLKFAQEVINEIKVKSMVDRVSFTASLGDSKNIDLVIERLKNISNYVRIGGTIILSFLITSSLLILLVILGMRVSSRRDEIDILQLIGATPGFVRVPFIFEGVFYAITGAFIGWLLGSLIIIYSMPSIRSYFQEVPFLPVNLSELGILMGAVFGLELLLALILGFLGSFVAIKRYLK